METKRKTLTKILFSLLLSMPLICACTPSHKERLRKIEGVLNAHPDSAWMMLCQDSIHFDNYSKRDRMKHLLLRAEAMSKLFYPMDTITYMDDVLDYYSSHGSAEEKAQANYMMGSVYRDRGDSPNALQYYNEAVVKLDTTKSDCNFFLLSKIYGQMAEIYRKQRYPQMEEKKLRVEASFALRAKDTLGYIQALERRVSVFHKLGNMDSVLRIASQAYQNYKKIGREDYAAAALTPMTDVYLRRKEYVKAKQTIDEYRAKSKWLDEKGNSACLGKEFFYNYLGWYYKEVGQMDSALWCYRKLLKYRSSIMNLEAGYKGLMSVYSNEGILDSVVKYSHLYVDANDTANFRNSATEVSRVQALFDYTESQDIAVRKAEEAKNVWEALFIALLVIVVLLLVIKELLSRNKKITTLYATARKKLFSSQKEVREQKEKVTVLNSMLSVSQTNGNEEKWMVERAFMNSKIIKTFQSYADTGKQPTDCEWTDLQEVVEKSMPAFWEYLSSFGMEKNGMEFRICLLTRLSFNPSQIANLLDVSRQYITNKRKKMVQKLFKSNNIKQFDALIKGIK